MSEKITPRETGGHSPELGSEDWFREEAWRSIHKVTDGLWDFSDSALIYSAGGLRGYKNVQKGETDYAKNVTNVEHLLLQEVVPAIVRDLPDRFSFLDLGPGTEHKERYLFEECRRQGKQFTYVPIDINQDVLDGAVKFAADNGMTVRAIQDRFESLALHGMDVDEPRFVSLGATYANYDPAVIVPMTLRLAGKGGSVMITAQLRERIDVGHVAQSYVDPALTEAYDVKLGLLDLARDDVASYEASDEIVVKATIRNPNARLRQLGMKPGDGMIVLKSYRHSRSKLEDDLRITDFKIHDAGKSFVVVHYKAKI